MEGAGLKNSPLPRTYQFPNRYMHLPFSFLAFFGRNTEDTWSDDAPAFYKESSVFHKIIKILLQLASFKFWTDYWD